MNYVIVADREVSAATLGQRIRDPEPTRVSDLARTHARCHATNQGFYRSDCFYCNDELAAYPDR